MSRRNIKILVVDDFELARNLLKNILSEIGFHQIDEASDGQSAFEKVTEANQAGQPFELVFSDWHMPRVSGLEFLKLLRADDATKTIPFIMVSAESETEAIVGALQAGAHDFVCKPLNKEALIKKVDRVLSKITKAA